MGSVGSTGAVSSGPVGTPATSSFSGAKSISSVHDLSMGGIPAGMSLDELMGWLDVQMRKSDQLIRTQMDRIQDGKGQQEQLSTLLETLTTAKTKADGDGNATLPKEFTDGSFKSESWYQHLSPAGQKAIQALVDQTNQNHYVTDQSYVGPEHPGTEKIVSAVPGATPSGTQATGTPGLYTREGTGAVKASAIDDAMKSMNDELSAAGSSNEMQMVQLQSAVSARGQALQLASNMIASFAETAKTIVGNTRAG